MSTLSSTELLTLKSLLSRAKGGTGFQLCETELKRVAEAVSLEESLLEDMDGFQAVTPTSMTDASKRRLTESQSGSSEVAQLPMMPRKNSTESFPPGITSLEMWGQTVVDFGKHKDRQWSYAEMMEISKSDAGIKGYVDWVRGHTLSSSSAQLKDFHAFIKQVDLQHGSSALTFPGSSATRKLKTYA